MKKLAIVFFGFHYQIYHNYNTKKYILVDFEKSVYNYNKYIFEYFKNNGFQIDIFFSTYNSEKNNILLKIYTPKKYIFHKNIINDRHVSRNMHFRNGLKLVIDYQNNNNVIYDNILITRFDLEIKIPLEKTNLKLDKFNIVSEIIDKKSGKELIDDNFYIITKNDLFKLYKLSFYDKSFHNIKKKLQKNFNINYIFNEKKDIVDLSFYNFIRNYIK